MLSWARKPLVERTRGWGWGRKETVGTDRTDRGQGPSYHEGMCMCPLVT